MPETSPEPILESPSEPVNAPARKPLTPPVLILGFACFLLLGMLFALNFRRLASPAPTGESIASLSDRLRRDAGEIAGRADALDAAIRAKGDEIARLKAGLLEAEKQNRALLEQIGRLKAEHAAGDAVDLKRQLDEANRAKAFYENRVNELEAKTGR